MIYHVENRTDDFSVFTADYLTHLPHIHSHLEMVYLEAGSCIVHADQNAALAQPGDIFLAFPNQIHYYNDQTPVRAFVFIFSPELFEDFRELFQRVIPRLPLVSSVLLPPDVNSQVRQILECSVSENRYHRIAAKGYLLALLSRILPQMDWVDCPTIHDSTKSVMAFCLENYTQPLTLDAMSEELHLSKFYISRIFKERIGLSFSDFVNTLRTEHACSLLVPGCNMADVAYASGFSSVRSFNRHFIRNTGMTPRAYLHRKSAI